MPIRQNILRKGKAPKQNLLGFDVFQDETGVLGDLSTSRFFKISEFPSVLPTGNSSFLIEGSDLLRPNVELKTELLDSAGNPIFHYAIPNYDKELPARRITIEIYNDDVVNGIGSFTVLGELDPEKAVVPTAFQNTYNVRFSAPVSINKEIKNTRPIRFYGDPTITVSELVKGVIQPVYTGNQRTKTITGSVSLTIPTPTTTEYGADDSTTADSTRIDEVGNSQATYISQNAGEAQSSILGNSSIKSKPYATYVVSAMEKGVDNDDDKITSTMKGATFSITSPEGLVDSTIYPDADWTKPTTFSTKILDVINSTTFTTTTQYKIKSKKNNQELVVPLEASASNSTITHNVGSVVRTASTVFQRSFANVTVGNLRTFSGDTYKAKIYAKEDGSSGEFEKIYETLVESPNELVDQNSDTGFKSVGIFPTQSIIDNFWVSSSNTFTATQDDDTIIDGVILSGSTEPNGNSFTFETSQSYSLEKNEPYLVDFDVAFKPTNKVQSDGTTKKDAKLEVFLTGTFLSETSQEVPLGEVDLGEFDFNKVNTFTKVKQKQVSDFLTHNVEGGVATGSLGFRLHSGEFILSDVRLRPFSETNFSPGFFKANVPMPKAIKRGQPYDFVVEFYDANNSLAEAVAVADDVVFAGPRQVLGDGNDGVLTGSVFLSNTEDTGIEFHGGSAYIRSIGFNGFERARDEGTSGFMMFSGSVSKSLNTSESYEGVGIEIISGSKGSDLGDKFLQFRTNEGDTPAVFKVQTDDFFLGGEGQFVSGSNGNIEISSSNLHIQSNGQITGSDVLFSGGTITSGVTIQGSVSANQILTPATIGGSAANVGNASASIDANGNAVFKSGSIGGFFLDDTEISSSGLVLKSNGTITGSNFLLEGGTITSDVVIQASLAANSILTPAEIAGATTTVANASASIDDNGNAIFRSGSIGGFQIDSTTLTATNFSLDTTNRRIALGTSDDVFIADADEGIFLGNATFGSAPFRVNMDGDLVATSVTVTGNITATAGPVSSSLTALGIATGSLENASSSLSTASSSLSDASSSFSVSASEAALTGSSQQTSLNAVGDTTASLLNASESMQKQFVLVDDDTLNLQNSKGGILSSFSDYAKFFGSASNALVTSSANGTVNYTEINDKGFLVVTGSSTASFFGNTTTIGDTSAQHISIAPDSFSIKTAANVTVLSASADGIAMSGSIQAGDGTIGGFEITETQINSSNDKLILKDSGQITGSDILFSGGTITSGVTIQGSVTADTILTPATIAGTAATVGNASASIDANGNAVFRSGSIGGFQIDTTTLTATNFSLDTANRTIALGTSDDVFVADADDGIHLGHASFGSAPFKVDMDGALTATSVTITGEVNATSGKTFTTGSLLRTASSSLSLASGSLSAASESTQKRFVLVDDNRLDLKNTTGGIITSFGKGAKFFGSASNALVTSSVNTNYSEINDKGFLVVTGSTTASFFGNTTTIGNTDHEHIEITETALKLKDDTTTRISMDSSGIQIGAAATGITLNSSGEATFNGTVKIGGSSGTTLTTGNTLNTNTDLGDVGLSLADISGSISGSYLNSASSSMASSVKIETTGISIDNRSGTSLASLTNSLRIGQIGDNQSRIEISSGALNIINRQGSTDTTTISLDAAGDATFTGTVTATAGDIGGWNINSNDLVGGAVRLEREGIVSATGSTSVGGATKQTKALFSGSADRGSVVSIQRDDFNGDLLDLVELHTSQSYVDDILLSYASGSDRDDVAFTRSGTSSDQSETLTFAAGGSGAAAWASNIFIRASGTGATNGKKVVIETAMADNQLLDTQEANNVVEIAFLNLTEELLGAPISGNVGKALVRYKIEIFQNDANTATGAELLKTFNISSVITVGNSAQSVNINQPIVLNKRYFFAKITGTNYDELNSGDGDPNGYKFSQTAAPIVAVKYLPKIKLNGVGFQTFAGPNQEVKLGAKNEIVGDLQLKETVADTRGNLQVEGKGAFGTLTIDDTFDLFVDGEIGATGNITGFYSSDKRLKENIVDVKEGLSIINQLRPVKFDWKDDSPFAHLYPTEYGLIAQEVEKIIPEIVGTMKQDYKGINYESLVPLLISSIIELTKRVKKLEDK